MNIYAEQSLFLEQVTYYYTILYVDILSGPEKIWQKFVIIKTRAKDL